MERFNSKEPKVRTFRMEAKEIIYSSDSLDFKVGQITALQQEAYKQGQEFILNHLIEHMKGIVYIDRSFVEESIESALKHLPIYE